MSRFHFHRWAVIFLLVSKLILGQFAHAMPHMAASASAMGHEAMGHEAMGHEMVAASASHDSPPCGSHVQSGSESNPSPDSNTDESAKKSCCEAGGCACPCLHSPAATAAVPFTLERANDTQVAVLVEGATWRRVSALFRPPA